MIRNGTLMFKDIEENKYTLPINNIKQILIFGRVSLTSSAIKLLLSKDIYVHFFSSNGNYIGSLLPKVLPGKTVIKQIEKYNKYSDRVYISKQIIEACRDNFYEIFRRKLKDEALKFKNITLYDANSVEEVMGKESQIFSLAYELYDKIGKYKIVNRTRRPPNNEANALLSFLNSILYSLLLTEIYRHGLLPSISYLHQPMENRPSLSLDIAEIFKPIFSFRLMIKLFNWNIINKDHFESRNGGVYLNDEGKYIVLKYVNKILNSKIRTKYLRKRSLKFLISWQVKKLKDFIEDKSFDLKTVKIV